VVISFLTDVNVGVLLAAYAAARHREFPPSAVIQALMPLPGWLQWLRRAVVSAR
jgi:hypothetical protein